MQVQTPAMMVRTAVAIQVKRPGMQGCISATLKMTR
jgi:hypothetical protein